MNAILKHLSSNFKKIKYLTKLEQIPQLTDTEREEMQKVNDQFVFRTNDYYQSLIDWDDPNDPIKRIIMPDVEELNEWGELDASNEEKYTKVHGLEHKYTSTALLLVNEVCAAYCRFCFRKRLFMNENDEVTKDISAGLEYIKNNKEINNVLLTGGDPMILSTSKLEPIIQQLAKRNIGVLITDHNVRETFGIIDYGYIMNEGELLIDGTPDELVGNDQARKVYLGKTFSM